MPQPFFRLGRSIGLCVLIFYLNYRDEEPGFAPDAAGAGFVPDAGAGLVPDAGAGLVPDAGAGLAPEAGAGLVPDAGAGLAPEPS